MPAAFPFGGCQLAAAFVGLANDGIQNWEMICHGLKLLRQVDEVATARPELWGEHADAGSVSDLINTVEHIDDVEAHGGRLGITRAAQDITKGQRAMPNCIVCDGPVTDKDGRCIAAWDENIHHVCEHANWEGIVPGSSPHLIPQLESKGIKVTLNAKGWIDIPV